MPTVLDLCGVPIPSNVQGRSLRGVLTGSATTHRQQVFIEYAPNDEAAVRDERWKLIFERGQRRRTDGYDPGLPLPGRKIRLYDLENRPARADRRRLTSGERRSCRAHADATGRAPPPDGTRAAADHSLQARQDPVRAICSSSSTRSCSRTTSRRRPPVNHAAWLPAHRATIPRRTLKRRDRAIVTLRSRSTTTAS